MQGWLNKGWLNDDSDEPPAPPRRREASRTPDRDASPDRASRSASARRWASASGDDNGPDRPPPTTRPELATIFGGAEESDGGGWDDSSNARRTITKNEADGIEAVVAVSGDTASTALFDVSDVLQHNITMLYHVGVPGYWKFQAHPISHRRGRTGFAFHVTAQSPKMPVAKPCVIMLRVLNALIPEGAAMLDPVQPASLPYFYDRIKEYVVTEPQFVYDARKTEYLMTLLKNNEHTTGQKVVPDVYGVAIALGKTTIVPRAYNGVQWVIDPHWLKPGNSSSDLIPSTKFFYTFDATRFGVELLEKYDMSLLEWIAQFSEPDAAGNDPDLGNDSLMAHVDAQGLPARLLELHRIFWEATGHFHHDDAHYGNVLVNVKRDETGRMLTTQIADMVLSDLSMATKITKAQFNNIYNLVAFRAGFLTQSMRVRNNRYNGISAKGTARSVVDEVLDRLQNVQLREP